MTGFGVLQRVQHKSKNERTMLDKEPYMSGETVFWRSLGKNMGFFKRHNTPVDGEGFWRSQGLVPIISDEQGLKWVLPNDLYKPEDAFRRWGNEINPLMAILMDARESVLNALAKYVWNIKDKRLKLGFEITWHDNELGRLVNLHFTEIRLNHYICEVEFEESWAYPDFLSGEEEQESEQKIEPIEEMPLDLLYEIIRFIDEKNKEDANSSR